MMDGMKWSEISIDIPVSTEKGKLASLKHRKFMDHAILLRLNFENSILEITSPDNSEIPRGNISWTSHLS